MEVYIVLAVAVLLVLCAVYYMRKKPSQSQESDSPTHRVPAHTAQTVAAEPANHNPDSSEIVGEVKKRYDGAHPFILDPIDGGKTWIKEGQETYEDAVNRFWRIV